MAFEKALAELLGRNQRSSALRPLVIVAGGLLAGVVACCQIEAPVWVTGVVVVLFVLAFASFLTAYFLFLFRDPDRLHSEDYLYRRRALEIGGAGDNRLGLLPDEVGSRQDGRGVALNLDGPRIAIGSTDDAE